MELVTAHCEQLQNDLYILILKTGVNYTPVESKSLIKLELFRIKFK